MPSQIIFKNNDHKNILLEDLSIGDMVQANHFVIVHNGQALLLDPGGHKVFSRLLTSLSTHFPHSSLKYIFLSHQDPDVVASTNGWFMTTEARGLISQLWTRFITHFGVDDKVMDRMQAIPDEGMKLDLGGCELLIIPAHFMHSPGNFQIYDPISKILFSGDLGSSLGQPYIRVEDFDTHIQYMEGFHRRYMTSNKVLKLWANMVRQLDIDIIAPQHGAMFKNKEQVVRFLDWIENLQCGVDLADEMYQLPK